MAKSVESTAILAADYIVVGGGLAGCVVASRLQQANRSSSILLIEAGPNQHAHPHVVAPLGAPRLHGTDLEWNYLTVPQKYLNNRQVYNCSGKLLSGSSAVNYGGWTRGPSADYDLWARLVGDHRWSYEGLLPYFRRTEHHHNHTDDPDQHGFDGPIHTTTGRAYPLRADIHAAFIRAGFRDNPDGNGGNPLGVVLWTEAWRDHVRQCAGEAYDLSGVRVMTSCLVRRVLLERDPTTGNTGATGVELADGRQFRARKEIIISCGALRTPQVLMLSGIGPVEQLQKIGVQQVVSSPEVGLNFHDHCSLVQFWKLRSPSSGLSLGSPTFDSNPTFAQGMPFDWVATDTVSPSLLKTAFIADGINVEPSHPHLDAPRAHTEMLVAYSRLGRPRPEYDDVAIDGSYISTGVLNLLPTSRGSIALEDSDPATAPLIDPNYYATSVDRCIMRAGLRRLMEVMETPEAQAIVEGEKAPKGFAPLSSRSTDEEIDQRVEAFSATWYHPAGSAAMGKVVDAELKVMGVKGLRVVDASVFPSPLAAHYQVAVYAIAEQASDMILKYSG